MSRILLTAVLIAGLGGSAVAQDPATDPATQAAPQQNPSDQTAPSAAPTKPTDQSATPSPGATAMAPAPTDAWIGRSVYSSDNQNLGEVAGLNPNPQSNVAEIFVDMGGLLGIGETRKLISADRIQDVQEDRIILKLTEAEADQLPAAERNE